MSLEEEFKQTRQAKDLLEVERAAPKAWRAGRVTQDGQTTVTTSPYDASEPTPEERALLEDHGFDPQRYRIVGAIKSSTWTAYRPKEYRKLSDPAKDEEDLDAYTFTAKAFKFNVMERPEGQPLVEDLEALIDAPAYVYPGKSIVGATLQELDPDIPYVIALGDLQLGKYENPTDELIERFKALTIEAMLTPMAMEGRGQKLSHIHLAYLGDCTEGFNSQGGKLRWRVTLTMTEQVRILRRLMLWQVKVLAPLADRITIVSIPGNHDEASSRDLQTRQDDSWAVEALVQVSDALEIDPDKFGHVECYVPGPDERGVTMEVGNTIVAHTHGHEHRHGKQWEYWQGQTFGEQPMGQANVWLQGHAHHLHIQEDGKRKWIQVPALEKHSQWWIDAKGTGGSPGLLTFQLDEGRLSGVTKHEPRLEEAA